MRIVVDTDCGLDDLLAIIYLLSNPEIKIEAITTVHGLASAKRGASNIVRVLSRLGFPNIPVYVGSEVPIGKRRKFPDLWIERTESLEQIQLPIAKVSVSSRSAVDYLVESFSERPKVSVLALGPLTNIALALNSCVTSQMPEPIDIVSMGGAVDVPGNLFVDGETQSDNSYAEWNFFLDPIAVATVFAAPINVRLVPLDATNSVPIRPDLLDALRIHPQTEASSFALEILDSVSDWVKAGHYFAWDPLAAVLAFSYNKKDVSSIRLSVETTGLHPGRLVRCADAAEIAVHMYADRLVFENEYTSALRNIISSNP